MSPVYGIDLRNSLQYIAAVSQDSGRPEISLLHTQAEPRQPASTEFDIQAVAIPDHQVIVKPVALRAGAAVDRDARLVFELAQTQLEPEGEFFFDALHSGLDERYVGLIYRRARLVELLVQLGLNHGIDHYRYLARAAALGRGYMTFCRPEGGELQCVADMTPSNISLCFLYRGEIVALGSMKLDGYNPTSDASFRRLAKEFKTLVNFKLAALSAQGVTVPLAVVVLTGELVTNQLFDLLSGYFPIGVASPRFNLAYIKGGVEHPHPELFLPALGAVVN